MNTAPAAQKSLSVSSQSASAERLFQRMLPSAVAGGSARAPPHNTLTATGIDLFEALVAGASINVAHAAAPSYERDMYAIHADDAEDYGGGKLKLQAPWSSDRAPSSRASSAYGRSTPHSHARAHFAASSSRPVISRFVCMQRRRRRVFRGKTHEVQFERRDWVCEAAAARTGTGLAGRETGRSGPQQLQRACQSQSHECRLFSMYTALRSNGRC
jgi:hypothetical protein